MDWTTVAIIAIGVIAVAAWFIPASWLDAEKDWFDPGDRDVPPPPP
jgi:hypothetical protein